MSIDLIVTREPKWSYGSRIKIYLCNQLISTLTLWVRIPLSRGIIETALC